jgi:hypothetical protein
MTPTTAERAALEKHSRTDARPIVDSVFFDVKDDTLCISVFVCLNAHRSKTPSAGLKPAKTVHYTLKGSDYNEFDDSGTLKSKTNRILSLI